ncbi:MAG: hypothetical protein ABFR89_05020 [Actinomycetota bacterium]
MSAERGAVLIGTLAVGFVFLLVITQAILMIGRLSVASTEAAEVAVYAAQHGARYGGPDEAAMLARELLPGADVSATSTGSTLEVEVRVRVSLAGPEGTPLHRTVTGRAVASLSPYRSRP